MNFPKHMHLRLVHQPHAVNYEPLETWIENHLLSAEAGGTPRDEAIAPADLGEIRRTGEVWELSWCPRTPVGSCSVVAASLERVLELAGVEPDVGDPFQRQVALGADHSVQLLGDLADLERARDLARTEVDARQALLVTARAERDQLGTELVDRRRDEQVDRDIVVRHAREDAQLARDERDLAVRLRDAENRRVTELERALDSYGDHNRYHDAIRRVLGKAGRR